MWQSWFSEGGPGLDLQEGGESIPLLAICAQMVRISKELRSTFEVGETVTKILQICLVSVMIEGFKSFTAARSLLEYRYPL